MRSILKAEIMINKNRIYSISQATNRKYADAKRIWEQIKDAPVEQFIPSSAEKSKKLKLYVEENKKHIEFSSVNYLRCNDSTHRYFFIEELKNRNNNSFPIVESSNLNKSLQEIEKDYVDRTRIINLFPQQNIQPVLYVLDESKIVNNSQINTFQYLIKNNLKNIKNYSSVQIYLLFVGKINKTYLSFPENIVSDLQSITSKNCSIFRIKNTDLDYQRIQNSSSAEQFKVRNFARYSIPKSAPFRKIKKPTLPSFALGIGSYDRQINWGYHSEGSLSLDSVPNALIQDQNKKDSVDIVKSVLHQSVEDRFYVKVLNSSRDTYNGFSEVEICETLEETMSELYKVQELINNRYKKLNQEKINNWRDLSEPLERVIVIIENIEKLINTETVSEEFAETIENLTRISRAAGVHFVLCGQNSGIQALGKDIRASFGTRIMCGSSTPEIDKQFFGESARDIQENYLASDGIARIATYVSELYEFRIFKKE